MSGLLLPVSRFNDKEPKIICLKGLRAHVDGHPRDMELHQLIRDRFVADNSDLWDKPDVSSPMIDDRLSFRKQTRAFIKKRICWRSK